MYPIRLININRWKRNRTMKKILATMMALALTIAAQAERIDSTQFVAFYNYTIQTQDDEGQDITDRMQLAVQVGRTVVKSMPRSAYKEMDMDEEKDIMAVHQEAYMHMPTVWTGYPEGQTTVRDWIFPHEFEGSEPTPEIAWMLTNDTLTVSGYYCQTATCKFRGVAWTVCYTEEIPSSAGPWRLRGLPGLIVKAESEAHKFCLTELRKEASSITAPEQRPDVQRMKYAKLLKHRNEIYGNRQYAKNPTYYVPDLGGSINNIDVLNHDGQQLVFANGHPLLTKAHVFQPLEKE